VRLQGAVCTPLTLKFVQGKGAGATLGARATLFLAELHDLFMACHNITVLPPPPFTGCWWLVAACRICVLHQV
jgi:hypothetical protein